jgi:membrane-associated phospholipid phosphatase
MHGKRHSIIPLILIFFLSSGINLLYCLNLPGDSISVQRDSICYIYDETSEGSNTSDDADNLIDKESITGFFNKSPVKPVKDILITGVNDAWALLKSPADWDSTSFLLYPSIVLATYFLMIVDEPLSDGIAGNKKYTGSTFIKAAEYYGRNITSELSAAGFTLTGIVFDDEDLVRIGLEIFESYYFANNIHSVVKRLFGRARPFENKGTTHFDPSAERPNPRNAIPSGHATLSFSLSTVLASHVDNTYLKILAYTPAVLTCFSRVYQQQHWPSDVFLGAAIGCLVGNFVVNRHRNIKQDFFSVGLGEQGRVALAIPLR